MKKFFRKLGMKFRAMDSLTRAVFIILLILAIATSVLAFSFVRNLTSTMTILNLPGAPLLEALIGGGSGSQSSGQAGVATPEPWDGTSRVTMLIMGLDYRDWQSGDTPHSDTMILLSLDPVTKSASMLSIPRDIWVSIPGFNYGRINESYFNGAAYNLPGGGPELARKTVEQFIGVPVQYYAVIEFNAFIKFIDEIDSTAKNIGAVNTVKNENGIFKGINTDATGAENALKEIGCKGVIVGKAIYENRITLDDLTAMK